MALVRKIKTAGLSYEEFAVKLLDAALSSGCSSTRLDVVFDVYYKILIKNAEHVHWKCGNLEFKKILGSQLIKQWNSFLSLANNKTELIKFIVAEWKKNVFLFSNKLIYVTCEREYFFIFEGNCSTTNHLFLAQEEADTHLLLHAQDPSPNYQDIIIHKPDTDVFTLAVTMWVIEAGIFIITESRTT